MITEIYYCTNNQHNILNEFRVGYSSNRKRKRDKVKEIAYTPAGIMDLSQGTLVLTWFEFEKGKDDLPEKINCIESKYIKKLIENYISDSPEKIFHGFQTSEVFVCKKCLKYITAWTAEIESGSEKTNSFIPCLKCRCGNEMEIVKEVFTKKLKYFFRTVNDDEVEMKCPNCGKSEYWSHNGTMYSD